MQPNDKALYVILKSPHNADNRPGHQLALHVQFWTGDGEWPDILCFYDTDRGHMIRGKATEIKDHSFTFEDRNGDTWELREVTIQEYRHRLAKTVAGGEAIAQTIKTTEDLWAFYRKTFPI